MGYSTQPTPPPSSSNVVLITLGVCALSFLELFAVVALYFLVIGGLFASRLSTSFQRELAREQARVNSEVKKIEGNRTSTPTFPVRSSSPPPTPRTPSPLTLSQPYGNLSQVVVNDRVHIQWQGRWYPGTVIEKTATQAKVHYDNYSDAFDELVTVDRLRRMLRTDPDFRNGAPVATRSTPKPTEPAEELNAPFNSRFPAQDTATRGWRNREGKVIFVGRLYANFGPAVRFISGSPGVGSYNSTPFATKNLSDADQAYVKSFPLISPADVLRDDKPRDDRPLPPRTTITPPGTPPTVEPPKPLPPPAAVDPLKTMRTWNSANGQFKLDATLLTVSNGQVQLQRADGKVVTMKLSQLSDADRELIRTKYPNE